LPHWGKRWPITKGGWRRTHIRRRERTFRRKQTGILTNSATPWGRNSHEFRYAGGPEFLRIPLRGGGNSYEFRYAARLANLEASDADDGQERGADPEADHDLHLVLAAKEKVIV